MKTEDQSKWVRIDDLNCDPVRSYIAKSINDCKGQTDKGVYDMALFINDHVKCGKVLGCPVLELPENCRTL
jgi:hypothetical protein